MSLREFALACLLIVASGLLTAAVAVGLGVAWALAAAGLLLAVLAVVFLTEVV